MQTTSVRTLQIIIAGLVFGVVMFAMVTFVINPPTTWKTSTYAWIGIAAAVSAAVAGLTIPQVIQKGIESRLQNSAESTEQIETQLQYVFLQKTIVGAALIESGIFLNLVFVFMEANFVFFACALGLLVLLALHFPTEGSMQQWLSARREAITGRRTF